MTELSGTLDGFGLPSIVRFLVSLNKTGCLRITTGDWQGEIHFERGEVRAASLGTRSGLAALDAMVECMPGAEFTFDSQATLSGEPSIRATKTVVAAHLDQLELLMEKGERKLPPADSVPVLIDSEDDDDEELPLERGALQTLVAVDGRRSVREIIAQRGTFDALWQLATLEELGLIELVEHEHALERAMVAPEPITAAPEAIKPAEVPAPAIDVAPSIPIISVLEPVAEFVTRRCPRLGFEDDRDNSFGRPTRLHRCFATESALPLSLDQQSELCLSEQFHTCPRLAAAFAADGMALARAASSPPAPQPEPEADDPRIVRLPLSSRVAAAEREPLAARAAERESAVASRAAERESVAGRAVEPARFRRAPEAAPEPPTPLRPHMSSHVAPLADGVPPPEPEHDRERPGRAGISAATAQPRFNIPIGAVAGLLVVTGVIATVGFLMLPQWDTLFPDDSIDTSALPNTSLVAAGTPVAAFTAPRATPAPANASNAAAPQANVAAQPTPESRPTAAPSSTPGTLFEDRFAANDAKWPSSPDGPAWITNGAYRVATRHAGQFVAIGAPIANVPADIVVNATFRKLAGPAGGGYGIIVRDQGPGQRDGTAQDGRYYVLEVGDKGEVGIWRRETDHWVDLLPWQRSDAVKMGTATNELSVRAIGSTLTFSANGTQVATRTDATLPTGNVGLFIGGDGNQVAVDRFNIQTP